MEKSSNLKRREKGFILNDKRNNIKQSNIWESLESQKERKGERKIFEEIVAKKF